MPDAWKSSDPYEQYRHWYHMDIPHDESDYADGVLPWAVEDNFNALVQYLRENDWDHAAQLAGVIGHYIEDASMPLHATSDYNPGNNHTSYESRVDYQISIDNVNADVPGFVPHKLDNIFDSTMQLLEDSYSNTDVLSFYLEYNTLWNDEIKNITENRLRTDIPMLANIWYTAFVQAGISSSPSSGQGIHVSILPESQTGLPGENLTFIVTITNAGTNTDNFSLTVSDTKGWGPTLSITSTTLAAGASSQNIRLSITIPNTEANGDSTMITVRAGSTGYENSATCTATATTAPEHSGGVPLIVYVGVGAVIGVIIAAVMILKFV